MSFRNINKRMIQAWKYPPRLNTDKWSIALDAVPDCTPWSAFVFDFNTLTAFAASDDSSCACSFENDCIIIKKIVAKLHNAILDSIGITILAAIEIVLSEKTSLDLSSFREINFIVLK